MSPKQGNRENSPYICAYNFHLISTHMHRYSNFDGVPPYKIEIKATTTYISNKNKQGLASKLYKN
jgi:hypothetical protein